MRSAITTEQNEPQNPDAGYRHMAAAVVNQAIQDVQGRGPLPDLEPGARAKPGYLAHARKGQRTAALSFLFAASHVKPRTLWLSWLNMTEGDLWGLLAKTGCRGARNRLRGVSGVRRGLRSVGVACG